MDGGVARGAEATEFGWFARFVPGQGFVPCAATDPEAKPNLNRLAVSAVLDRKARRFVLPTRSP